MLFVVAIATIIGIVGADSNGTYVVTAPKTARTGTPYTVTIVLTLARNAVQTGTIELLHETDKSQRQLWPFSMDPLEFRKEISMTITEGQLMLGKYMLLFEMMLNGMKIQQSTEIELLGNSGTALIQTDKGIYKRSQTVKLRAFLLDMDLKAVKKNIDISIIDAGDNKVERFSNQSSNSGVVIQEFQLSDDPKLGDWKIQVQTSDGMGTLTEKTFTVDAYVLPRFSVEVKPSVSFVYVKDFTSVEIDVKSLYTYGEGVQGSVQVQYALQGNIKTKTARLVDGKANISITTSDIGDPSRLRQTLCAGLFCYRAGQQSFKMSIKAEVTEDETNEKQKTEGSLDFYTEPVAMKVVNKKEYRNNMEYTFYLEITNPSGGLLPPSERSNYMVNLNVTSNNQEVLRVTRQSLPSDADNCIIVFTTVTTTQNNLYIQAELTDASGTKLLSIFEPVQQYQSIGGGGVQITLRNSANKADGVRSSTKMYDVGDTIFVHSMAFSEIGLKLPSMFLFLFSKGKLLQSYDVTPGDITQITIAQDMNMAPSASLLLYSVTSGGELVADEMKILVSGLMKNQMTMQFNVGRQEVGRAVTLNVNSDPNSFIFLVSIDKGSKILKEPNSITTSEVEDTLKDYDIRTERDGNDHNDMIMFKRRKRRDERQTFYTGTAAKEILETVGMVYMTDAAVADVNGPTEYFFENAGNVGFDVMINQKVTGDITLDADSESSQVRKNFPETWIWLNELTGADGTYQTTLTLPDTITAWVTHGFSFSPANGLAIAQNVQVEGFKRFFVVVSLPASAIREEKFEVKLVAFNYFTEQKSVRITLKHSRDFELYEDSSNTTALKIDFTQNIQVPAGLSKGTSVYIKATTIGNILIRAEVSSGTSIGDVNDIVEKILPVDPEGKTMYGGVQELFEASSTMQSQKVFPTFPSDFVADSGKVKVSVTGDIMGQSLQNLDSMIRTPYGCGEQNMISLVPNIYALSYMMATNNVNPEIKQKAIKNMQQGYQRELNYKHPNGGYSAFGTNDIRMSTWLTSFVMKSFAQASKFIFIDDQKLESAMRAIMDHSIRDGSFIESGRVIHKDMMTGTSSGVMLTAYVYISLQETQRAGYAIPNSFDSSLTLKYLENFYQDASIAKTPFQMAVIAYCFALGGSQQLDSVLTDINDLSTVTESGDMKCWCNLKKEVVAAQSRYMTYDIKPSAIETASYVMLTYLEKRDMTKARPIAKWLVSQINGKGGFLSTQDTVMGLQALSSFAALLSGGEKDVTVIFKSSGNADVQLSINNANSILLQSWNLANIDQLAASGVTIEVQGSGNIIAAVNWEYNVEVEDVFPDLHIDVRTFTVREGVLIEACFWYAGLGDYGMGMVYVDIPTGYQVTNMNDFEKDKSIKRVEINGRTMAFYFNQILPQKTCLAIKAAVEYIVLDLQPSPARAQFYYQPEKQSSTFYSLRSNPKPTGGTTSLGAPILFLQVLIAFHIFKPLMF